MKTPKLNFLVAFIFLLGIALPGLAQRRPDTDKNRQQRMEKIESARTAFITDKLNLTPEQAQKFWPVYNEYTAKRKELKLKGRPFRGKEIETMSDKEIEESLETMFDVQQAQLNLEKSYAEKFKKIISIRQLAFLYKSEREFTKVLLKRLDEHQATKKKP